VDWLTNQTDLFVNNSLNASQNFVVAVQLLVGLRILSFHLFYIFKLLHMDELKITCDESTSKLYGWIKSRKNLLDYEVV
jgi:hypothetical protein